MYWGPKEQARKLMSAEATNEGGNYGPGSWMYWDAKDQTRKLQGAQEVNEGGNYGEWRLCNAASAGSKSCATPV
jgi:hypothetical protein